MNLGLLAFYMLRFLFGQHHIKFYSQLYIQPGLSVIQGYLCNLADTVHAVKHCLVVDKQLFGGFAQVQVISKKGIKGF